MLSQLTSTDGIMFVVHSQDTRGSFHRSSGPAGTLSTEFDQKLSESFPEPFSPLDVSKTPSEFCLPNESHPQSDLAIFTEFNAAGSLFSIHSAPPPVTDSGTVDNVQITNALGITLGGQTIGIDSPRRPASLALDSQQSFSAKTIAAFPMPSSEIDDEDNENLLTVSSLTARPLIAKSRELRSSK